MVLNALRGPRGPQGIPGEVSPDTVENRVAAEAAATLAGQEADTATAQRQAAETARGAAQTARAGSETARSGAEAAQAGAASERQAAQTARTGSETARSGSEAALGAAQTVRDQAQAAVGQGRVTRDTLTGAGGLATALAFPDGAIGEVLTGSDAGYYVKVGASGTGSWAKKSDRTVPSLGRDIAAPFLPLARPGDSPFAYVPDFTGGDPGSRVPLDASAVVVTTAGAVYRAVGARNVTDRALTVIEPGRVYEVRFVLYGRGASNSPDAQLFAGLKFLGPDKLTPSSGSTGEAVVNISTGLKVTDGRKVYTALIARQAAPGVTIVPPSTAAYMIGFVATGAAETGTDIETIEIVDVTAVRGVQTNIDTNLPAALTNSVRPGDALVSFVPDFVGGEPYGRTPLSTGAVVTERGGVYRAVGAKNICQRQLQIIEDGRVYELRITLYGRGASNSAPAQLYAGLQYFGPDKSNGGLAGVAVVNIATGLKVTDGRRTYTALIARSAVTPGVTVVPPEAAAYMAGFVATGTAETGLDIETIEIVDVTRQSVAQESADRARSGEGRRAIALGGGAVQPAAGRATYQDAASFLSGFAGWGLFDKPATDDVIDGFVLRLSIPAAVASWQVLVVERLATDTSDTLPGQGASDRILSDLDPRPVWQASVVPTTAHRRSEETSDLRVDFTRPLYRRGGYIYMLMVRGLTSGGTPATTVGAVASAFTGRPSWELGWAYNGVGNLVKLTGALGASGYLLRRAPDAPRLPSVPHYRGTPTASGLTVDLRDVMRVDLTGVRPLYTGSVTLDPCTTGTATKSGFNLRNYTQNDYLDHAGVSALVITVAATGATLTQNVDLHWDPGGRIYSFGVVPDNTAVNISYNWANERWDLIVEVPEQGTLGVIKGTERAHTAHEDLYRPKPASSLQRPVYWARVVGGAIAELIPAWDWHGSFSVLRQAEIEVQMQRARRLLGRTRRKLARGEGIVVAIYGDSNSQCGGGAYVDASSFEPNRYNAQGATDLFGSGGGFYDTASSEADFRAALQAATPTVVINGATRYKLGPHWRIIDGIIREYGYTLAVDRNPNAGEITYLNCGIGATTMESSPGNMGDPNRLAVLCNPSAYGYRAPDLIVIQAGMNNFDPGSALRPDPNFPAQLDAVIAGIRARCSADILVYGMHLTNVEGSPANRWTMPTWQAVNAQIREACLRLGVAYAPTDLIQGPGAEGYMGQSAASACRPGYANHPGPRERRMVGDFLATLFTA